MDNRRIAATLDKVAELLAARRQSPFRVRSYRRVARNLREMPEGLAELVAKGADLTILPGVGENLAAVRAESVVGGLPT